MLIEHHSQIKLYLYRMLILINTLITIGKDKMNMQLPPDEFGSSQDDYSKWDSNVTSRKIVSLASFNLDSPRISGLRKQTNTAAQQFSHSNIVRFPPDRPTSSMAQDVFETVRIIHLARLRMSLKRKKVPLPANVDIEAENLRRARHDLLELLDSFHNTPKNQWPEVVIIRRPNRGGIQTNHAVLADMIYLGAHLSEDWTEGKEGVRFFVSLREALLDFNRAKTSRFEASVPRF